MDILKLKKMRPNAVIPERATNGSAGIDLSACIETPVTVAPGERLLLPTGIAIGLPGPGYVAMVFARSGLSIKHGLNLANSVGVIDSDYRGEIQVGLLHQGTEPYTIAPGERIAQLVVLPVCRLPMEEAETLDDTSRGTGGFGSTGTN